MIIENIKEQYNQLNLQLKNALSTMERSDNVFIIREKIKDLQKVCPHSDGNFDYSDQDVCPYCGKKFKE